MQIKHLCNENFDQLQFSVIFFLVVFNLMTVALLIIEYVEDFGFRKNGFDYWGVAIRAISGAYAVYYVFYALSTVNIMADALDIRVFLVKKKSPTPSELEARQRMIPSNEDNHDDEEKK